MKDKGVKLANFLCGKIDDGDICCSSDCTGARQLEHNLEGIWKNDDVKLWHSQKIDCGGRNYDDIGGAGGERWW